MKGTWQKFPLLEEKKVFQGVPDMADEGVGRKPTARVVGCVAEQLKIHADLAIVKEEVCGGADDALEQEEVSSGKQYQGVD